MQRDEHNKPVLEWILSVCIEHMYDIIDMSSIVIHLNRNDYHPKGRDSVMVGLFPKLTHLVPCNVTIFSLNTHLNTLM